jgi:hypothetical protein
MPVTTSTNVIAGVRSGSYVITWSTTTSTATSAVHRIMERKERDHHDVENRHRVVYEAEYDNPKVISPNPYR